MQDKYRVVSGIIFGVVAVLQGIRALSHWPVQVGPMAVPIWISWVAVMVAGSLCIWAFTSRGR